MPGDESIMLGSKHRVVCKDGHCYSRLQDLDSTNLKLAAELTTEEEVSHALWREMIQLQGRAAGAERGEAAQSVPPERSYSAEGRTRS